MAWLPNPAPNGLGRPFHAYDYGGNKPASHSADECSTKIKGEQRGVVTPIGVR
jgi:hypothetical protein